MIGDEPSTDEPAGRRANDGVTAPLETSPRSERPGARAVAQPSERRNNSLDGLRGIAVLLVMGVHIGFPLSSFGWLGVDIFFVLSGFLITTLLCDEHARHHRISLPKFWARRFLRLMPAYWLYVGSLTIAMLVGPADHLHADGFWTPTHYIVSLWCYFGNYAPFGGLWTYQQLALHLWSLAVEEQYYFVWPVLCALALRYRRAWLLGLALLAVILVCRHGASPSELKGRLPTRGIGIVMGSTLALYLRDRPARLRALFSSGGVRMAAIGLAVAIYVTLGTLGTMGRINEDQIHAYVLPWLCLLFAFIVGMLWHGPLDRLARALSWSPLAYLGRISYGLYLYHMLAQFLVWHLLLHDIEHWNKFAKYGVRCVVFVGLTTVIASLSYRVVERPFLRIKNRVR